jgi:Leucine-rich repeat (LRR) protein
LKELWISNNKIVKLPDKLPKYLDMLNCKYNELPELPPYLLYLLCSNNKIKRIFNLPKDLRNLDIDNSTYFIKHKDFLKY